MKNIRERIRINGEPISEELFTRRFFEVWDKLPDRATPLLDIPRYLQLLALTSYHVFILEKVDVAIYETHLGGEFDATNIVRNPVVTAVTSIAMDHVKLLGPTVEDIAWHKAGIFKPGSLAFSALQLPAVTTVLQERAAEKEVVLEFVDVDSALPTNAVSLKPKVQRLNCSLAFTVVRAWLRVKAPEAQSIMASDSLTRGVKNFFWPGRFQQVTERNFQWFLDGAHNELSVQHAVQWYAETASENPRYNLEPVMRLYTNHFQQYHTPHPNSNFQSFFRTRWHDPSALYCTMFTREQRPNSARHFHLI
jgi:folylpolyglutamate synthase